MKQTLVTVITALSLLAGCATPTAERTATATEGAAAPTATAVPPTDVPTATPTYTSTSTPTHTPSPDPTNTPAPTPTACPRLVLDLPFDPDGLNHETFIDGPRRYGIYWFDVDPTEGVRDWRGLQDTYDTHRGTDFSMAYGSPVFAAADGWIVRIAGHQDTPPLDRVVIHHGCGYFTAYHHIKPTVSMNQFVRRGEPLGTVDIGPPDLHLHFELEYGSLDDCAYLRGDFACPVDVMTAGLWSDQALAGLYGIPEVQGYEIPE